MAVDATELNSSAEPAPMSTRRARAMATIDAAILAAQQKQETPDAEKLTTPGSTLPIIKKQQADKPDKPKLTTEQEEILAAQEKLLGEQEAQRLREEQEREAAKSGFVKGAEKTLKNAQGIVHGADVRIGSVPTPGNIAFPLILLLLFFFILIQVNGSSRLGHLWRVIVGAERIGPTDLTQSGPGPGDYPTNEPTPTGENPEPSIQTQGQGGSMNLFANLQVIPQLPVNGVFTLGEW